MRRDLFDKLKGFDERFFVYYEDLDFSLRAKLSGYESWFIAEASACHSGGGTTDSIRAERLYYYLKSRIYYGFKHFGNAAGVFLLFVTVLCEPISRLSLDLVKRSPKNFSETFHGFRMLIRDLLGFRDSKDHDLKRFKLLS